MSVLVQHLVLRKYMVSTLAHLHGSVFTELLQIQNPVPTLNENKDKRYQ